MAAEQFANRAQSTLAVAIVGGDTTLQLVSGSAFSGSGDYRVIITHPTNSSYEYCKITARSSNNLTATRGQEGTSAQSFPIGSTVTQVLTAAGMTNALGSAGGDSTLTGTDAAKSASQDGNLYFPNNGFQIYRDTGAAFAGWGPAYPFTAPVDGDFAWINQGSASVVTTNGGIALLGVATAGATNLRIRKKAAPSTPYTITLGFNPNVYPGDFTGCGLLFRQSSDGKVACVRMVHVAANAGFNIHTTKFTDASNFSADYNGPLRWPIGHFLFLQISDDGTNRISRVSNDGVNFVQVHSVGRTDFLTANEVGFFVDTNGSFAANMTVLHWKQA